MKRFLPGVLIFIPVVLMLILASCRTDKQVLCEDPVYTAGNVKIISRQCFLFGDRCVALIDMFDSSTGQKFQTVASVVDQRIVFTSTRTKENLYIDNNTTTNGS